MTAATRSVSLRGELLEAAKQYIEPDPERTCLLDTDAYWPSDLDEPERDY